MRVLLALTALLAFVAAAPTEPQSSGQVAAVNSETDFCFFLPPEAGGDIATHEDDAIAFCTKDLADAPNARVFPDGFIQSAHFVKTEGHVQVTGTIDISKYQLSGNDEGGQYDIKAPVGASCAGYDDFVNLVEPKNGVYCIRCCNDGECDVSRSTQGCEAIVPGDYSGPTGN
ncbi:uncharacterized protein VTP21DRAFT_11022 [Calcarisporiella thermophila]|uniref:uncharacterized protein n=1 Tax=Calcarisporiella thermophila TaxID=911321 RepID=UPI00374397FF